MLILKNRHKVSIQRNGESNEERACGRSHIFRNSGSDRRPDPTSRSTPHQLPPEFLGWGGSTYDTPTARIGTFRRRSVRLGLRRRKRRGQQATKLTTISAARERHPELFAHKRLTWEKSRAVNLSHNRLRAKLTALQSNI